MTKSTVRLPSMPIYFLQPMSNLYFSPVSSSSTLKKRRRMELLFPHHSSLLNFKQHLNLSSIHCCRLRHRNCSLGFSSFHPVVTTTTSSQPQPSSISPPPLESFTRTSRFSLVGPSPSFRGFYLSRRRRPRPFFATHFSAKRRHSH